DIIIANGYGCKTQWGEIANGPLQIMPAHIGLDAVCFQHAAHNMRLDDIACSINNFHRALLGLIRLRSRQTTPQESPVTRSTATVLSGWRGELKANDTGDDKSKAGQSQRICRLAQQDNSEHDRPDRSHANPDRVSGAQRQG